MKKLLNLFLIAVVLLLTNCKNKTNEISDEVVLKIGNIEITKYEFEKNKERFYDPKSGISYKEWLTNFIDETYFLAEAFDKRYDTIASINKQVDYTAQAMISQVGGYLWEKIAEPQLAFSDAELKTVYKKRDQVFYLEYLRFPDKTTLINAVGNDTIIKTEEDFIRLTNKCRSQSSVNYNNRAFVYPFDELEIIKEHVSGLSVGSITELLHTSDGIFAAHVIKKESIKQQPFKAEREQILGIMRNSKAQQIINNKNKEVFSKANIVINDKIENDLLRLIKDKQAITNDIVCDVDTLMTYVFNNQINYVSSNDFLDYYRNTPFMPVIEEKQELSTALNNLVMQQYEYSEADSLGIFKDKRYVLDKKNYKNRLILPLYYEKEFYNNIQISNKELQDYYQTNEQSLTEAEICYVSFLIFKDQKTAMENFLFLNDMLNRGELNNLSDTSLIKGLIAYQPDIKIKKNNAIYPPQMTQNIFKAPVKTMSGPEEYDNKSVLFIKTKEEGKIIKPFEEMEEEIRDEIKLSKFDLLRREKIKTLKTKYPILVNKIYKI